MHTAAPVGVEHLPEGQKPVGITKLGPGQTPKAEPTFAKVAQGSPGAVMTPTGRDPAAFIMHHTSGRGTPAGIVEDWRKNRPGVGTQFILDREGNIHDVRKEFGYQGTAHIIKGSGAGAGLTSNNTVGMEVIARDDKDVNQKQIEAAKRFIREHYPNTPVIGDGLANPGHREADEGKTITDAIRAERSTQAAK
jgi:hypothetical protein